MTATAESGASPLSDLLAKLETAPEASRELDALLAVLVEDTWRHPRKDGTISKLCGDQFWRDGPAPHYTTSLDAALKLIPEDYTGGTLSWPGYDYGKYTAPARADLRHMVSSGNIIVGYAATPALALCIAALKAREEG